MFRKNKKIPACKPDPPTWSDICFALLVVVCAIGFSFSLSELRSINDKLRHEERTKDYILPEIAIPERRK